jgi:hypothetical protein
MRIRMLVTQVRELRCFQSRDGLTPKVRRRTRLRLEGPSPRSHARQ